jgi:hypothetical protein
MDTWTTAGELSLDKPVESIELLDRGRASQVTRGFAFQVLFELGAPPFNTRPGW